MSNRTATRPGRQALWRYRHSLDWLHKAAIVVTVLYLGALVFV